MVESRWAGTHRTCTCCAGPHRPSAEAALTQQVDAGLVAALFPDAVLRRSLLRRVGAATLLAALADLLPLDTLRAVAQDRAAPEKTKLAVGFLPITCAMPLIMGFERGTFAKQGLDVTLQKIPGIALIRDKMINGELDLSQQVMPVPLATTAGVGGTVVPTKVLTVLNQNGNSLVLANKHANNRDPRNWKGFRFAIPFELSHQTLQLRYYLAKAGLDPDRDVTYRVVPPSEYVSNLRTDNIDGFFGGEPGGQRAVYERAGFIHLIGKDIWPGHPCCSVTATSAWIEAHPNSFMAFFPAAIEAGIDASDPAVRAGMAKIAAQPGYLNQPEIVIEQVIGGRYADGLGQVRNVPDRVAYDPFPHPSMALWLIGQMKRWKMMPDSVDAKALAAQVMLATDARRLLAEAGAPSPGPDNRVETIMGDRFDADASG
jgi:nitrate/nitrite transport system substrate-binding protein